MAGEESPECHPALDVVSWGMNQAQMLSFLELHELGKTVHFFT